MRYLNNNKNKNNTIVTETAKVLLLTTIILITGTVVIAPLTSLQSAEAQRFTSQDDNLVVETKAPVVVSGDNIYIAWWTNNTANGNEEVMFRASTDGGATFSNSTNLSNTTDVDSWRVEMAGEGETVIVSWWETNQTSDVPVARISTDGGETFGPMIMLAADGTVSGVEEEAAAATEEDDGDEEDATAERIIEEEVGGP
jgi:hypothetical protein